MTCIVSRRWKNNSPLNNLVLPPRIGIRAWEETDFPSIQKLSTAQGWPTPTTRADDAIDSWRTSWPTLVITDEGEIIGFLRAITDGYVTTYIAEILISPMWRGHKLGKLLIEVCHRLNPSTRLDLLSTETAHGFYEATGFRRFVGFRKSLH